MNGKPFTRTAITSAAVTLAICTGVTNAEIVSGTTSMDVHLGPIHEDHILEFGDGENSVELYHTFGTYFETLDGEPIDEAIWAYGVSPQPGTVPPVTNSEIAFVPDVLDPSEISDASIYDYGAGPLDQQVMSSDHEFMPVPEWPEPAGVKGMMLLRNVDTGHYGAIRLDDLHSWDPFHPFAPAVTGEFSWWFQTDGSGDFSSVPAPGAVALFGIAGLIGKRRRVRT